MSEQHRRFTVTAIGVVRRVGLPDAATSAPAGSFDPCAESLIEIYPEWAAGLAGIEGFSHLAVILYLDTFALRRADEPLAYRLPWLGATRDVGLFGTSSPYRPNPLVIRYPRLLGRSHNVLRVSGLSIGADTVVLDVLGQSSSDRACRGFAARPRFRFL